MPTKLHTKPTTAWLLAGTLGLPLFTTLSACQSSPMQSQALDTAPAPSVSPIGSVVYIQTNQPNASQNTAPGPTPGKQTLAPSDATNWQSLVAEALQNSPAIAAAQANWEAAKQQAPQAQAWPDPKLTVGVFLEPIETRTGPQRARIGLQQTLPLSDRLTASSAAAEWEAAAAHHRHQAVQWQTVQSVLETMHALAFNQASQRIAQDNLELLASFESVVAARYRVGTEGHPQLIRVQLETSKVQDRIRQLAAQRLALQAKLQAILNRPNTDGANTINMDAMPNLVAEGSADHWHKQALQHNPELLALDAQTKAQAQRQRIAEAMTTPDLTVGLDYTVTGDARMPGTPDSSNDPVMLSVGINLPIWAKKNQAAVAQAVHQRFALANQKQAKANALQAAIHQAWFEHQDAQDRVRLYNQTLVPQAQASLQADLAAFRTGDASFLNVLDTQRSLLQFELAAEQAKADRGQALARLVALVGAPIDTHEVDVSAGLDAIDTTQPQQ